MAKLGFCRLPKCAFWERGKTAIWRHGGKGAALWGLGKTAIWRYGGKGAALWRLGKTAILLEKCCFTKVLGTLAKLGFCRPPK